MFSLAAAASALTIVMLGWLRYLSLIPGERVPRRPYLAIAAMGLGAGLAVASLSQEPSMAAWIPSAAALSLAGFFFFLLAHARQPPGALRIALGEPLIAFSATTSEGAVFHTDELHGQRTLLKFFRGHW